MSRAVVRSLLLLVMLAGCTAVPAPPSPPPSVLPMPTVVPSPTARPTPTWAPTILPVAPATGRIAFLRTAATDAMGDERQDAYVVDADGSNLVQLTDDRKIERYLYWLRDGSRIVIAWERHDDPYHQFLASTRPDGTDRIELGRVQTAYSEPQISPNGRYIAFGGDGSEDQGTGVKLLDLATGKRIDLTSDGGVNPIWSPDGTRILSYLPSRRVSVVDVATGTSVASIALDAQRILGWASDGSSILFKGCSNTMTKPECMAAPVLIARLDGSPPSVAQDMPARVVGNVSPDGAWVAALDAGCSYTILPIVDVEVIDIATAADIESACSGPGSSVSWSPDSRWLALGGSPQTGSVITLVTPLGPDVIGITEGADDGAPAWQPLPEAAS